MTENEEYTQYVQQKIERATTRIVKQVLPHRTNNHKTVFGGQALKWMDEAATICALRFSNHKKVVTVSVSQTDFTMPVPAASIVELIAKIIHVGHTTIKIQVDFFVEQIDSDRREKAITGWLTFVALNKKGKPTRILDQPPH